MVGIIRRNRTMTGQYNGGLNKIFRENITEFKTRAHFGHVRKMENKFGHGIPLQNTTKISKEY
jgi:hypothetical protein